MSAEEWRAVPGFEGIYEVSDLGRVRSLKRYVPFRTGPHAGSLKLIHERILVGSPDRYGYPTVDARHPDGKRHMMRVHQFVLRAFVGEPSPGQECLHGNGNPRDNRLSNLRWGTRSENIYDAVRHGTRGGPAARKRLEAAA
jgi:hypothetical protein